jgi:probable HAF family extracellular repeat protein
LTGPDGYSAAEGLNNRGQIVGQSAASNGEPHAVLWDNGTIVDLGTLSGYVDSFAAEINDRGQIAGANEASDDFPARATLWMRYRASPLLLDRRPGGIRRVGRSVSTSEERAPATTFVPDLRVRS